jgi:hypothetical protein
MRITGGQKPSQPVEMGITNHCVAEMANATSATTR